MRALTYHGAKDVRVDNVPDPKLQAKDDIILKVTATAICGSDLIYTAARSLRPKKAIFLVMNLWGWSKKWALTSQR